MKKYLVMWTFAFLFLGTVPSVSGQKIYLFSDGDVQDKKVGQSIGKQVYDFRYYGISDCLPERYVVGYNANSFGEEESPLPGSWTGPDIMLSNNVKEDILRAIDACPAGSEDAIVFFWSGHGAFDEEGHYLYMPKGRGERTMRRTEILDALKRKNPRLIVFITDSCHVFQKLPEEPVPSAPSAIPPEPMSDIPPLLYQLFFNCHGVLDINTSSVGQKSYCGLFVKDFVGLLKGQQQRKMSWRAFLSLVDQAVIVRTKNELGDQNVPQKIYAWSLPEGNGQEAESRANDWSRPIYRPEIGDLITEVSIGTNSIKIRDSAHFLAVIANADNQNLDIVLTLMDQRTRKEYYLLTKLLPKGNSSRLGIRVRNGDGKGAIVTEVIEDSPGYRCKFLNNGDVEPVIHFDS